MVRKRKPKAVELGCAGHFICARDCTFRRHTQIGDDYRVSTVGEFRPRSKPDGKPEPIGAGPHLYETLVFKTTAKQDKDNDGCGCHEIASWGEIDGTRWMTAGEAQKGHENYVRKYMALVPSSPRKRKVKR